MEETTDILIRKMEAEDYDQVYRLWTQIKGFGIRSVDDSREGVERFLRRNPTTSVVAVRNGRILGNILCGHDGRTGCFYHVCVAADYRKHGIGCRMARAAMEALLVGIILVGDFLILRNSTLSFGKVIMVLITVVAVIYIFTMIYIFPVLSRFENTVKNTIRNSFLMSILNLPKTILLVIINLVPAVVLLVTLQAMPIVILFGFSVPAYVASMLFVKIFKRFEPEEEEEQSDELETLSFIREEQEQKQRALEEEAQEEEGAQAVQEAAPEEKSEEENQE